MTDELYHYGVKGMKWGVRRDLRVLANHRRNQKYKKARDDYEVGKITKSEKKQRYKVAKQQKKDFVDKIRSRYNTASEKERRQMDLDIKRQSVAEVPNRTIKKGATTVNRALHGYAIGSNVAGAALGSIVAPPLAPMLIGSAAISSLAAVGEQKLIQWGLDRLS